MSLETTKTPILANTSRTIKRENSKGFDQWNQNVQISMEGIGAGVWTVEYLPHRSTNMITHAENLTITDIVVISGPNAPIMDAIQITCTTAGDAIVTSWARF